MSMRDLAEEFITLRLSPLARSWPEGLFQASGRGGLNELAIERLSHLEVRTPEEAIAAAERVVGAPTPEEQAQRLASVGSWEHWNRVSCSGGGSGGANECFGYQEGSEGGFDSDDFEREGRRTSPAIEKDWGAHIDPSAFEEISDEEEDAGARPTAAKPTEDDVGARSTAPKPAEASDSSSSSSESDSSSSEEDGGSGRGEGDPQSDEDIDVVELSPAMPKHAQAVAAEEIVQPLRPKGALTKEAINSFREVCAAAEAGDLVAQLSRSNPMELFINANEALIQAFALNAAASTSADRRMTRLAEEKEALRHEVSVEVEKRRRAEASADAARGEAETARAEAEASKAEAGKAKEALAAEMDRLRAELKAAKDAEARQAKENSELRQRAQSLETFVVDNLDEATLSLTEVLQQIGTECRAPDFGDLDPIGDRAAFLKVVASSTEQSLKGFALMADRVAGQGVLQMLHDAGCNHLEAATSATSVAFGGQHLVTPPTDVCGAWRRLQEPWKAQGCEAVLELQKALRLRRVKALASPNRPSTSTPPPPKSNASSGMGVAPDIRDTFLELQMKKAFRYVIFKIEEKQKQIVVEKTGAITESYDDFLASLPENDCRYALYDFDFVTGENVQKSKIFFIAWSPSTSRIRAKMLYSTSKDRIKQELDGFHYEIQATDPSEVDLEVLRERAH
ncbi:hypothetical protein GUJ93_ZPchr0003g16727 [Zizania palustris]|uniref:ADF-H domain-containing protein n=1 Tax=Zizania palustris TaxID=103762 RepID=A0A8J5S9S4_ZIZPA|nr:hypothetical protein GUJ93_ZPchr0003g16727 [Zizania palustris]